MPLWNPPDASPPLPGVGMTICCSPARQASMRDAIGLVLLAARGDLDGQAALRDTADDVRAVAAELGHLCYSTAASEGLVPGVDPRNGNPDADHGMPFVVPPGIPPDRQACGEVALANALIACPGFAAFLTFRGARQAIPSLCLIALHLAAVKTGGDPESYLLELQAVDPAGEALGRRKVWFSRAIE